MNRTDFLAGRDERAAAAAATQVTLAEALADRDVILVRIRCHYDARFKPYHDLIAFTASFRRVWFNPASHDADLAERASLIAWFRELYPTLDWRYDVQFRLDTGEVQSAPEADQRGFIPDDELEFGGSAPVYLPCLAAVPA